MNVNPGKLRKKIQILKKSEKRDKDGYTTGELIPVRKCNAYFKRLSMSEKMETGIDLAEEIARFLVRYSEKKADTGMLIQYNGEIYHITAVNDYEDRHEYVEITARKGRQEDGEL